MGKKYVTFHLFKSFKQLKSIYKFVCLSVRLCSNSIIYNPNVMKEIDVIDMCMACSVLKFKFLAFTVHL